MQFDMNRTWSQALALVRKNFQLLALIAGVFMLLPSVLFYVAFPEILTMMSAAADQDAVEAQMMAMMPQLPLAGLAALLLQMVGYMAMIGLIGNDRPTVGQSIVRGVKGLPALLGAVILFAAGYIAVTIVFGLVVGLLAAMFGMVSEAAAAGLGAILSTMLLAIIFYVMVRFCLTLPAIVLERLGPLAALRRSWRLTKPRAGAIFAFFALLFVAYMVISLLLFIVFGAFGFVAGSQLAGGTALVLGLLSGVVGALTAVLLSGIMVSIHEQLAGGAEPRDLEFDA
jgi:membrane-anchored glycerophosphoryl diester phosphodiesterase (GDPDase)